MATQTIAKAIELANLIDGFIGPDALEIAQRQVELAYNDDAVRTSWEIIVEHLKMIADE